MSGFLVQFKTYIHQKMM